MMKNILIKLKRIICLCAVRCSCFFSFHDWRYIRSEDSRVFKGCSWHKYECKHCNMEHDKFSW